MGRHLLGIVANRRLVPFDGFGVVLRYTKSFVVHEAEIDLRAGIAFGRKRTIKPNGIHIILPLEGLVCIFQRTLS